MGTLLDLASLVVVPSGYKEDKIYSVVPTDGSGDLDFTRASSATRVNSAGLIEKVRTNLLLQSNQFDTTWTNTRLNTTSGQTDPDGGTTAWKISNNTTTSSFSFITQSAVGRTYSIYAKAGEITQMMMYVGNNRGVYFDLTDGSFVNWYNVTTNINYSSESVGGGWYRYTITLLDIDIDVCEIYTADAGNIIYNLVSGEGLYIWRSQLESGDIATDYIPTTSAAVSVGMTANVPRLDYLNSSCPSLLLEPQRTNLVTNSENIGAANWTNIDSTDALNVTATLDPAGYNGADKLQETTANAAHVIAFQSNLMAASNTYTFSAFLKAAERTWGSVYIYDGSGSYVAYFNLATGIKGSVSSGASSTIQSYGNGWYRCSITLTFGGSALANGGVITATADGTISYAGTTGSGIFVWGAQVEAGSYPTSYIPTLGTSVTRVADAASKTGISSLIGQTEGTLFVDFVMSNNATDIVLFDITGSDGKLIWIRNAGAQFYGNGTTLIANIGTGSGTQGTRYKVAFVYGQNDFRLYRNGSLIGTDTSGTFTGTFSDIALNSVINQANLFNQVLIFKTKLTNTQLATLTTL